MRYHRSNEKKLALKAGREEKKLFRRGGRPSTASPSVLEGGLIQSASEKKQKDEYIRGNSVQIGGEN